MYTTIHTDEDTIQPFTINLPFWRNLIYHGQWRERNEDEVYKFEEYHNVPHLHVTLDNDAAQIHTRDNLNLNCSLEFRRNISVDKFECQTPWEYLGHSYLTVKTYLDFYSGPPQLHFCWTPCNHTWQLIKKHSLHRSNAIQLKISFTENLNWRSHFMFEDDQYSLIFNKTNFCRTTFSRKSGVSRRYLQFQLD